MTIDYLVTERTPIATATVVGSAVELKKRKLCGSGGLNPVIMGKCWSIAMYNNNYYSLTGQW